MVRKIRWRWGVIAALAMTLLSIFPQLYLWRDRGSAWNGSHAFFYTDEPAYTAYINALIDGRPRRNDPYTGRDYSPSRPLAESLFSIQFIPAYFVALPARALGLSSSTLFILLAPITAFSTALALFWLLAVFTDDDRAAAALVPFVLCLGVLITGNGVIRAFLGQQTTFVYLPFLRRYVPAVAFPFLLAFFPLISRALVTDVRRQRIFYALAAGIAFAICVYSYFYLWTTAVAWLALVSLLWLVARPQGWRAGLMICALTTFVAVVVLVPYCVLLSHRAPTMDTVQALVRTRAPDPWRPLELIALTITAVLAVELKRGRLRLRDPQTLLTAAFALLPFLLFNQQIVTGRSLQPMHYEQFVASYTTLIAAALTLLLLWRDPSAKRQRPMRLLLLLACLTYAWGAGETWIATRRFARANVVRDEARAVSLKLRELARASPIDRQGQTDIVFAPDFVRADTLPMSAPQAVLWAPHMFVFSGVTLAENKERFFQFLYYSGVNAAEFERHYEQQGFVKYAIFGWERANPKLTAVYKPITQEELAVEARNYADYVTNFDATRATQPTLAYLLLEAEQPIDLANLDRWYRRDAGERIGRYLLYRLTPRQ
ncbi:MAG: hypothetical protein ABJB97_10395 [Acidobacteriota bacterium]